jgi:hypothetical protein
MVESKYDKYLLKRPKGALHDGTPFEGWFASPEDLGVDCQILYSTITEPSASDDMPAPHKHDFPHVMGFFGSNPLDYNDWDADIEFYLDGEKQVIDAPSLITVPKGLMHCPLVFRRVGKPVVWVEVMLTSFYERK